MTDNDGDAVLMVCNIVHGNTAQVPDELPLHGVRSIAAFCIEFGLLDAISPNSTKWVKQAGGNSDEAARCSTSTIAKGLALSDNLTHRPRPTSFGKMGLFI